MAEIQEVAIVQVDTSPSLKSMKDFKKEIQDLKSQLLTLDEGTDEYNQTLIQLGNTQHQLNEINEQAKLATQDIGQTISNVSGSIAGFTGAIQIGQGALNLFGVESQNATKMIAQMQNIMAITSGFSAIDSGVKSFSGLTQSIKASTKGLGGFKTALISTGLGAIVVLIGSIVANWEEFAKAIGISDEQLQAFGDAIKGVISSALGAVKGLGTAISRLIRGDFAGAKEAAKNAMDFVGNYKKGVEEAVTKRQEEESKKRAEAEAEEQKKKKEAWDKYVQATKDAMQSTLAMQEALHEEGWKYTEEAKEFMTKYFDSLLKLYVKDSKEYNDILIQKLNYNKAYNKNLEQEQAKAREKERKDLLDANNKEIQVLKNATLEKQLVIREQYANGVIDYQTMVEQLEAIDNDYQQAYLLTLQKQLENTSLTNDDRIALQQKYYDQLAKIQEDNKPKEEETSDTEELNPIDSMTASLDVLKTTLSGFEDFEWANGIVGGLGDISGQINDTIESFKTLDASADNSKEKFAGVAQIASQAIALVGSTLTQMANQQDKTTKKGFEKSKKMQIAGATMNTLSGAVGAFGQAMSAYPPPAGAIIGGVMAALITGFGMAQIAKIKQQKFDGGSDTGVSNQQVAINQSALDSALQNEPEQVTTITGASQEQQLQQRVYVLESDITSTQNRVNVIESESTF